MMTAMGIGRFAYTPILPLMQKELHFSQAVAGYLASSNYLGYLLGALLAGVVNWGDRKESCLRWSLFVNVVTTAGMGWTTDLSLWLVLRFVSGVTSALVFVLASSVVLDVLAARGRMTGSGIFYGGVGLGIAATGLLVPLFDKGFGWRGAWAGLAVCGILFGFFAWRWLREGPVAPTEIREETTEIREGPVDARSSAPAALPWLIAAYGCEGLGYIVSGTFLVAIVEQIPQMRSLAPMSWVLVGAAAAPSAFLWARIANKRGYVPALMAAYLLQAAGIVLPVVFLHWTGVFLGALLFGGTFMGITAVAAAYARRLSPQNSSRSIGYLTAVYGTGQVLGPAAAGILAETTGGFAVPLILAAAVLLIGAGILTILRSLESLPEGSGNNSFSGDNHWKGE